ncbi:MAG: type IX secretion system membrane protein PorP/SprF [Crocinitomicaceae bacterium]
MKLKRILFTIFLLFNFLKVAAQDLEFTQFYANPIYLNPAMAGSHGCPRVAMNYRNQWPSLSGSYVSYAASYDQYFSNVSGGLGLILVNDVQAKTINTTSGSLLYSYHAPIGRKWTLMFGAKASMTQKSLDWSKLTFGDMIDPRKGFIYKSGDVPRQNGVTYFDASAGFLVFNKMFNFGVAANHLNQPNESMIGNQDDRLPMRLTAHASYNHHLGKKSKYTNSTSIMPSVIYTYQNGFWQLNLGTYVKYNKMTFGVWYRSLDAFVMTVGINTGTFKIGYSYDITVSKLGNQYSGGSHELSLGMNFNCRPKPQKFRKLSCPSF